MNLNFLSDYYDSSLTSLKSNSYLKKHIKDPRYESDYSLDSLLMFCLYNHLFRLPSKNKFHQNFKRISAAKAIAKFCGFGVDRSPCPRTTDDLLLELNPEDFHPILPEIFRNLCRQKVFQLHPEFIPKPQQSRIPTDHFEREIYISRKVW